MNRFINALLLFFLLVTMTVAIFVGFDLPIQFLRLSGANLPYQQEIFLGLGLIILIINLRRTIRRWMGMRIVKNVSKFKWNVAVSKQRKSRIATYLMLEATVMLAAAIGLYLITPEAWLPSVAFLFGVVDNIIFMIVGGSGDRYRVGLSTKALIVADREVILLYFTGLQRVTVHQQSIYFDYIKGLQLSFPTNCIPEDQMDEFFGQLESCVNRDKVFFIRK